MLGPRESTVHFRNLRDKIRQKFQGNQKAEKLLGHLGEMRDSYDVVTRTTNYEIMDRLQERGLTTIRGHLRTLEAKMEESEYQALEAATDETGPVDPSSEIQQSKIHRGYGGWNPTLRNGVFIVSAAAAFASYMLFILAAAKVFLSGSIGLTFGITIVLTFFAVWARSHSRWGENETMTHWGIMHMKEHYGKFFTAARAAVGESEGLLELGGQYGIQLAASPGDGD